MHVPGRPDFFTRAPHGFTPGRCSRGTASGKDLVSEWLSVKRPEEVDILRKAAALTAQLDPEVSTFDGFFAWKDLVLIPSAAPSVTGPSRPGTSR